jgi:hypothetical protein
LYEFGLILRGDEEAVEWPVAGKITELFKKPMYIKIKS